MPDTKKTRCTDEQIVGSLKQAEAGMPTQGICYSGGWNQPTVYKWRSRFCGMEATDAAKPRYLEAESAKLERLLAEAHLDIYALKSVFGVTACNTSQARCCLANGVDHHLPERRACRLMGLSRDGCRHPPQMDDRTQQLSARIVDIAHTRCLCNWPRRSTRVDHGFRRGQPG